jgi:small subunit ribosomal protein S17
METKTALGQKRQFTGTVVSAKMTKTVVVSVSRTVLHPKYRKRYTVSTRLKAHDEKGEYKEGDTVRIEECKPLSRSKRWRVIGKAYPLWYSIERC